MFLLEDGREELFQWDINRAIVISDSAIDQVHFSNTTTGEALVVEVKEQNGKRLANIPNILLQEDWSIKAYGYAEGQYTKQMVKLKVNTRSKPEDYVYTETELLSYKALAEEMLETLGDIEAALEELHNYAESVKAGGVAE